MQQHTLSTEKLSIPYSIDNQTHEIEYVMTNQNHSLFNASQYAAAFIGCKQKMAGRKLAVVAARIPTLNHMGRVLAQHDKVLSHVSTLLIAAGYNMHLYVYRSNLNL